MNLSVQITKNVLLSIKVQGEKGQKLIGYSLPEKIKNDAAFCCPKNP